MTNEYTEDRIKLLKYHTDGTLEQLDKIADIVTDFQKVDFEKLPDKRIDNLIFLFNTMHKTAAGLLIEIRSARRIV